MNHTPGPWGVFGICPTCIGAKDEEESDCLGRPVALTCGFLGAVIGYEESIANAHLVAAAPELLEACEAALRFFGAPYDNEPIKKQLQAVIEKAKWTPHGETK